MSKNETPIPTSAAGEDTFDPMARLLLAALDTFDFPIHIVDTDLKIRVANRALFDWCRRLGVELDRIIGRSVLDVFPFLPARVGDEYREVMSSGQPFVQEDVTTLRGRDVITMTRKIPITDDRRCTHVITILEDITERRMVEKTLDRERVFIDALLETANCIIVCLDQKTNIVVFNKECARITGYTAAEVVGKRWADLFLPAEALGDKRQDFTAWIDTQARATHEGDIVTRNGQRRTILWSTSSIVSSDRDEIIVIAVGQDITGRKKIEEALRKSEEFNRAVIDHSPLGISVRSRTGQLLSYNEAWRRIWGLPDEAIDEYLHRPRPVLGFNEHDNYLGEWLGQVKDVYQNGGEVHVPAVALHRHRGGEVRWVSQHFYAIKDSRGQVDQVVILTDDITDRKRAEEALRESEGKYRLLIENVAAIIAVCDYEGTFLFVNESALHTLRLERDKIIGKTQWDIFPPEVADNQMARIREVITSGETFSAETSFHIHGHRRWFDTKLQPHKDADGKTIGALIISHDVTERRNAKLELQESEEKFRMLAEQTLMAIFIYQDGLVKFTNRAAAKLTGYSVAEMMAREAYRPALSVHPEDREFVMEQARKKAGGETEGIVAHHSYRILDRQDRVKWVEQFSRTVIYEERPADFIVLNEITERKAAEEALLMAQQDLERRVRERTDELATTNEALQIEREALEQKNVALQEILNQIEEGKKQTSRQIQANVERVIIPVLETLAERVRPGNLEFVRILRNSLQEITSPFINQLENEFTRLTPREIEVCNMVKSGMSCKNIAATLNISVQTVLKQRSQIRKKLGIAKKNINLASFLKSIA